MALNNPTPPSALDHVALWVSDREPLTELLCDSFGMHEIERTDAFTLLGADARRGKITLFTAEGSRDPGPLKRIVLRVRNLAGARAKLPSSVAVRSVDQSLVIEAPEGLQLGLVERSDGFDYDLDHVVLAVKDVDHSAEQFQRLGFQRNGARLVVGDKEVRLLAGDPQPNGRPLLNHLALLVESADDYVELANQVGASVEEIKDAPNTYAVFVAGPSDIRIEYVEHKPSFALQ